MDTFRVEEGEEEGSRRRHLEVPYSFPGDTEVSFRGQRKEICGSRTLLLLISRQSTSKEDRGPFFLLDS